MLRFRYMTTREKIMPFFTKLASRAMICGERDPITNQPVNPAEDKIRLETTKGYIRKLVNDEINTTFFVNQIQHILKQELAKGLAVKLDKLMVDVRQAKKEYDAKKQKVMAGSASSAYTPGSGGQHAMYGAGAAAAAATLPGPGVSGAGLANGAGGGWSNPNPLGNVTYSTNNMGVPGGGGMPAAGGRVAPGPSAFGAAPATPNQVVAIMLHFTGEREKLPPDAATLQSFLDVITSEVNKRIEKIRGAQIGLKTSQNLTPGGEIQMKVEFTDFAPAGWDLSSATALHTDIMKTPIALNFSGIIFQTHHVTLLANVPQSVTTATGAAEKRKRPRDADGPENKRLHSAGTGGGKSVEDRMKAAQSYAHNAPLQQPTMPAYTPASTGPGFPPPSPELLAAWKIDSPLLNLVPLEIRLHKKVATMLGEPGEEYEPKAKPRIGPGVQQAISTLVQNYLTTIVRRVHRIHIHRLHTDWHDVAEQIDDSKRQLELHAQWDKDVQKKAKEDLMERTRREASKVDASLATKRRYDNMLSEQQDANTKKAAANDAAELWDFGAKKKRPALVLSPPLQPPPGKPSVKLRALKRRKKGERGACAAIVYIKKEPGTETGAAAKPGGKLPVARPKKKTAPISMRDMTTYLEADYYYSKSPKLFRAFMTLKGGR